MCVRVFQDRMTDKENYKKDDAVSISFGNQGRGNLCG